MAYKKEFKLECIKIGKCSIGDFAKEKQIPKQTLSRWIKIYNRLGPEGLDSKKPGPKGHTIDPKVEELVLNLWGEENRTAYKMHKDVNRKDGPVSKRDIYSIYKKNNLIIKKSQE
jgi:hypothetical protein